MSKIHVLCAAFLGTLVYVAISFCGGQDGLWAERQLEEQVREISMRTAELSRQNEKFELEYLGLRDSPEVIAAYARKLGYVAEGEKLVKINGLPEKTQPVYKAGTPLKHHAVRFIPEWVSKTIGFSVFFLLLLVFLLSEAQKTLFSSKKR